MPPFLVVNHDQVQCARVAFPVSKLATSVARPAVGAAVVRDAPGETAVTTSLGVRPAAAQASGPWAGFVLLRYQHHA